MAKPSLGNITTSQTFQVWFDKTNELVNLFKNDAITASGSGDTTTGDATLVGDFAATNLLANTLLQTDAIASASASGTIDFQSPIEITGAAPVTATFTYGASGGRIRFSDGSLNWDAGIEDSTDGNFIIDTGVAPTKFELSPAGTLTIPNLVVLDTITANTIAGGVTVESTDDVPEGTTNLYYTTARANTAIDARVTQAFVNALNINASTVGSLQSNQFLRSDTNDSASGNYTFSGDIQLTKNSGTTLQTLSDAAIGGNLVVTGQVRAVGNVITNYSSSDKALKENVQIINNALDKVSQVNGYTFNYIDRPEERVSGIIAQEVEKVLPEIVFDHERNNGTYKAVRYEGVIPLLIEAIKELKEKVNDLENRLSEQR